jgi:flagellar motor component MotA
VIHVDHALAIAIGAALVGFLTGCVAAFGVLYDPTASKENHRDHNDH